MANSTPCLTPDAQYHTTITDNSVTIKVDLPFDLDLDEREAQVLETLMHNQLELILRTFFE